MALRTVSNTGGNWNATTAWVGGVVPIAGDTVDFTPTSGNLIVNVATAVLAGVDFTNYVNTITFNNIIQLNTNLNLGTGGYTQAGTSGLSINANTTISGTTVWTRGFFIAVNAAVTLTLSSNLNITDLSLNGNAASLSFILGGNTLSISNNISFIGGGTYTLNIPQDLQITNLLLGNGGGNRTCTINGLFTLSVSGNLIQNHGVSTVSGTTSIVLNGTGTWSNVSTGVLQNNLTINSPSGTITISGNVYYNTGTLTYIAGTVDTTTNNSTLNIGTSTTLDTDRGVTKITWNNITITAGTTTLSSNLTVGGTLSLTGTMTGAFTIITVNLTTGTATINVTSTSVTGNLTINGATSGTSTITLNGTGAQTWSHGSAVYLSNSLTINKSSGTLTLGANVYYNTGTLLYTAGTVDTTTNNSILNINASTTLDTSTITWRNVGIGSIGANTTITLSSILNISGTTTLTSNGTFTLSFTGVGLLNPSGALSISQTVSNASRAFTVIIPNDLTITNLTLTSTNGALQSESIILTNNIINITGNLLVTASAGPLTVSGTTNLNLIGTGTWSYNNIYSSAVISIIQNNLTINSPSGTITISGNVYYSTGTLTYTAGTVTTTGSTLGITNTATLDIGSIIWNNVTLAGTQTLLSNLNGIGTLNTSAIINGFNIIWSGNLTVSGTTSGTTSILLNGNGIWSATSYLQNNLTINSPSGTITISGNVYYQTGTLTYTAGTVTTASSTLNIGASTTLDVGSITWNNVTIGITANVTITLSSNFNISGTTTFTLATVANPTLSFSGVGLLNPSSTLTINNNATASNRYITVVIPNDITITNLFLNQQSAYSGQSIILNGYTINVTGNLTHSGAYPIYLFTISGTTNINLIGTGTWSHSGQVVGVIQNNLTINSPSGTITISGNVYYNTGTLTYTTGTVITTGSTLNITTSSTLNTSGMTWNNVTLTGTQTLNSDLNIGGNLTTQTNTVTINGLFNVNVGGNLTINIGTSGTSTIILNGTGNQTWSHGSAVYLGNNLTINKASGTLTIGTNVYYRIGTLTYTAGTVDTTTNNSTLNINASTTLNSNGLSWNNLTVSGNTTLTLPTDLIFIGTCSMVGSGTTTITLAGVGIINAILGTLQLTVSGGNLTLTTSATHNILNYQFNAGGFAINGSGTWNVYGNLIRNGAGNGRSATGTINFLGSGSILFNGGSTGAFVGVWNINPSGTLTFGSVTFPNVYYEQSTITYIGGTVDASNCNLLIGFTITNQTTTLNTSPINWKNITLNGANTLLLTSDLNLTGNLTTQTGIITINGLFNVNVGGNLTINVGTNGTSAIRLVGTGTWSGIGGLTMNLTIVTSGTITVSGTIYYTTGTITYTTGTVITTNSLLFIRANTTIATGVLSWNNVFIGIQNAGSTIVITLNDNFTIGGSLQVNGTLSFTPNDYLLRVDGDLILGYYAGGTYFNVTLSIPNDLIVRNLNYSVFGINTIVNGFSITILGNLSTANSGGAFVGGTTNLILGGTGNWSQTSTAPITNNLTINTPGTITITGNVYYNTGRLTFVSGKVITKNSNLNLTAACTLINCHKINFDRVVITSGVNITMNEFFNGLPNFRSNILASSTTNYTITFQDGFEKFSKFIKLSRATISRPNQLTVITDKGNQGNNVGVKFAPNQLANGLPKNTPSTSTVTPYGLQPSYLVTDPTLS